MNKESPSKPVILQIEGIIYLIRGQKVMLDSDLAKIYGTTTTKLNQQVSRNRNRFPPDFMFQLSYQEVRFLISQNVISSSWGGRRKLPYVFTEHGAVMLAGVLNTPTAVSSSVGIVRAFIKMRELLLSHKELAEKLDKLEKRYDAQFQVVFNSIRELINTKPTTEFPAKPKRKLGFQKD